MPSLNVGPDLNTANHEAPLNFYDENRRILLFANNSDAFGRGDIYSAPVEFDMIGNFEHFDKPVNSAFFEGDAFMAKSGEALLLASDRPGAVGEFVPKGTFFHSDSLGNTDLYVVLKIDGEWSEVLNLGDKINTPFCEQDPFLSPDEQTLYFSSDGHPGLGGLDIFRAERLNENSWTEWSTPVNIGKDINGSGDEFGCKFYWGQDKLYFCNSLDIYKSAIPKMARPSRKMVEVYGRVRDEKGRPVECEIVWVNSGTNRQFAKSEARGLDGKYSVRLESKTRYAYSINVDGFYPINMILDLRNIAGYSTKELNINLMSVEEIARGAGIVVENIHFDFNEATLQTQSYPELNKLSEFLKKNSSWNVEISGHTDYIGRAAYNKDLSLRRAKSVVKYLVMQGISVEKLIPIGYGENQPRVKGKDDEARAKNRRVEFRVISDEELIEMRLELHQSGMGKKQ